VKNERRKGPTCKKSITGLVGCGAAPRCISGIEIAKNEKALSGSHEAKKVVTIVRNVLR
jgi:hypothetical protein